MCAVGGASVVAPGGGQGSNDASLVAVRVREHSPPASTTKSSSPAAIWRAVRLTSVWGMLPPWGVPAYSRAVRPHSRARENAALSYFHDSNRTTRTASMSRGSEMPASAAAACTACAMSATGCGAVAALVSRSSA